MRKLDSGRPAQGLLPMRPLGEILERRIQRRAARGSAAPDASSMAEEYKDYRRAG